MPVLNLTEFEEPSGFKIVDPGKYFATVYDAEDREVGDSGKMPEGTPMLWVHFLITGKVGEDIQGEESPWFNARVFRNYVIPPDDYDEKAKKIMNGMLVQFLKAIGYTEEEILSGSFSIEAEDVKEKEVVVQVNRRPNKVTKEIQNNVVSVLSVESVLEEGESTTSAVL